LLKQRFQDSNIKLVSITTQAKRKQNQFARQSIQAGAGTLSGFGLHDCHSRRHWPIRRIGYQRDTNARVKLAYSQP